MVEVQDVPKGKQTVLELYVTAKEAYEMWKAAPRNVAVLDVRTPEEYGFVGHAEMARNIPIVFVTYKWDTEKNGPVLEPNAAFLDMARSHYKLDDTILVTCRSGGRAAAAINVLAQAGFERVYNIVDGIEGDMEKNLSSANCGQRTVNGWKNSGAPWTYTLVPELMWIEK